MGLNAKGCQDRVGRDIHVDHATAQTGLQGIRVPSENVHNECPSETGKCGPGVLVHLCLGLRGDQRREGVRVRLKSNFREGNHHASEDVDDNLIAQGVSNLRSEIK